MSLVPIPSARLLKRVTADFGPADRDVVVGWLTGLRPEAYGGQDAERVQAALVLAAGGDLRRFESVCRLLFVDWRDALVTGGLANADWPQRLDQELSPH